MNARKQEILGMLEGMEQGSGYMNLNEEDDAKAAHDEVIDRIKNETNVATLNLAEPEWNSSDYYSYSAEMEPLDIPEWEIYLD